MDKRIYANARFKDRYDTTQNWEAANPILLKGERGIEEFLDGSLKEKIGNGVDAWNDLPYFTVEGSGSSITVDQTYTPDSENAQSGKAVAEAISTISGDKAFEKIATITVAPDTDGTLPTKIIFSADDNGQPFELTDLYCNVKAGITTGSKSTIQVKANGELLVSNSTPQFTTSLRYWYFRFTSYGENKGGLYSAPQASMGSKFPSPNTPNGVNLITPINLTAFNKIPKVEINIFSGDGQWIADSTFELWGVRA